MTSGFVDFHCHLDLYPDFEALVGDCEQRGIFTLAVTTTPRAWPRNNELAKITRHVRAALGLHPQLVADRAGELSIWEELLPQTRYVGEVGLDAGPRFYKSLETQKGVFERVLILSARARDKIVSVHSVRATKAVLDMLEQHMPPPLGRVILHWFSGSEAEARRAVDLGCYFSINSQMLVTERHQRLVRSMPIERLLTETDGPFIAFDGRPIRPMDVGQTVEILGGVRGVPPLAMAEQIRRNLKAVLVS